jgi:hypothetical protein
VGSSSDYTTDPPAVSSSVLGPGDVLDDRFEIARVAESGGMGIVFRGVDRRTGRDVAVKLLHAQARAHAERFLREARTLAKLRHPGVVRHVAHGVTRGRDPYLVMEWLEGEDLGKRLARGRLSVEETIDLGRRVARALGFVHRAGVVHRDVKPSNLFLAGGALERVILLDFGVASGGGGGRDDSSPSGSMRAGTPSYMAPEQVRRAARVDARADVFALGCVLFECLTGEAAFPGRDERAVFAKILLAPPRLPSTLGLAIPARLERALVRMLAKDPAERPGDGAAVARALPAASRARRSSSPPTLDLGAREQRLASIIVASGGSSRVIARLAEKHGGRAERLAGGAAALLFEAPGAATDLAARAARAALSLSASADAPPAIAVATGRRLVRAGRREALGEVIDRAIALLGPAPASPAPFIAIDEMTRALLGPRFVVDHRTETPRLLAESAHGPPMRLVAGRPSPFVGRERECTELAAFLDECRSDRVARAVLLTGPPGIGKTRLAHETIAVARSAGAEVWIAEGAPLGAGSAYALVAQLVAHAAGITAADAPARALARLRARLASCVDSMVLDRVAGFLGELVGAPPDPVTPELLGARRDPRALGDQVRRAFEEWVAAECATRPLVILFDDLHWGDRASVELVDATLRNLSDRPILVVGVARSEIHERFPELWRDRGRHELRVGPLSRRAAEALVRELMGKPEPSLAARAQGNAFFLEELVRAHLEGKGDALPPTIVATVEARLGALDPEARAILRAASVYGQVFWTGAIAALIGRPSADVADWLATLVQAELVTAREGARFAGEAELEFRHALVREAAYATLTDDDRALAHAAAGTWLEAHGERDAALLAEHFERGGDRPRAARAYLGAAWNALAGHDPIGVRAHAARGLVCAAADDTRRADLEVLSAEACLWMGDEVAGLEAARAAFAVAPIGSDAWHQALGQIGLFAVRAGDAKTVIDAATALAKDASPRFGFERATALARLIPALTSAGAKDLGDALYAAAAPSYEREGRADPAIAVAHEYLRVARAHQEPAALLEASLRAVEAARAAGNLRREVVFLGELGEARAQLGLYADAEHALREAVAIAERRGLDLALIQTGLGMTLGCLGKYAEADATLALAAAAGAARNNVLLEATALAYRARAQLAAGAVEAAEQHARRAAERGRAVELWEWMPEAIATHALTLWALGRRADALAAVREAGAHASRFSAATPMWLPITWLAQAEILAGAGAPEAAREILAARDRVLAEAERLPRALAPAFLAMPDHARLLTIAQRFADSEPA